MATDLAGLWYPFESSGLWIECSAVGSVGHSHSDWRVLRTFGRNSELQEIPDPCILEAGCDQPGSGGGNKRKRLLEGIASGFRRDSRDAAPCRPINRALKPKCRSV